MFDARETSSESLGFSPTRLAFGHSVHGVLANQSPERDKTKRMSADVKWSLALQAYGIEIRHD